MKTGTREGEEGKLMINLKNLKKRRVRHECRWEKPGPKVIAIKRPYKKRKTVSLQDADDARPQSQRDEEGNWNRFIYTAFKKNCLLVSGKYLFRIQTKWCHFAFNPERPPPFSFHFLHFSFILFKVKQKFILYNRAVFCVTCKASLYKEMDTDVWDGRSDGTARMCLGYSLQGKKKTFRFVASPVSFIMHTGRRQWERESRVKSHDERTWNAITPPPLLPASDTLKIFILGIWVLRQF